MELADAVAEEPAMEPKTDPEPIIEYQPKPYGREDCCDFNPEFAIICSFIKQFGDKIDLELNIEQLKRSIEDESQLDESLLDLHFKLLRKIRRYLVRDQWEKALIRFVSEYSYEDAYEIESVGYLKTRPSIKLQLLRRLLDAQFENDQKFKASVNTCEANELRISPIGRDLQGNTYWNRSDAEGNLRIFQEQPLDYKSWKTVCSNPTELNQLIENLDEMKETKVKGEPISEPYNPLPEIFPEFFHAHEKKEEEEKINHSKKSISKSRKGRNQSRGKKPSLLPVLNEAEENCGNNELTRHEIRPKNELQSNSNGTSLLLKPSLSNNSPRESVEFQVKATIENLINRVVSSLEYLLKPLSSKKNPPEDERLDVEQEKKIQPQRKRPPKREKFKEEVLPRRSSSRIQQLQQKKLAEQEEQMKKMIESNANKKSNFVASSLDEDSRSRSTSSRNNRSGSPDDDTKDNRKRKRNGQSWRRGKGKKKLSWDQDDSDLSDTSSLTESNDEDFDDSAFKFETSNYEDEFACEEEETNIEPVIIKRARTARQSIGVDEQGDLNTSSVVEEDKPCGRCDKSNDPEWILLCDMCDDGYHTSCCVPPLMMVPDGDWFCPPCEHKMLLTKLRELYTSITDLLNAKELERKKRQRLRQNNVKKIQPAEVEKLPEKRKRDILLELNEPIALQDLNKDLEDSSNGESSSSHRNRSKIETRRVSKSKNSRKKSRHERRDDYSIDYKKSRKTYSRRTLSDSDESQSESEDQSSSSRDDIKPKTRRARASVSYRFQEYDELIKSAIQGDSYNEEEGVSENESVPDSCNYGKGKDMATIEALAYQQENGIIDQSSAPTLIVNETNADSKQKSKKKGRRLNDLDVASETEDASSDESFQASSATEVDDEDEDMTEADSCSASDTSDELISNHFRSKKRRIKHNNNRRRGGYSSDGSDYQPRTRRAAAKQVSYRESTDDDDTDTIQTPKKIKKKTLSSDEESQNSWKSPLQSIADDDRSTSCAESPALDTEEIEEGAMERLQKETELADELATVQKESEKMLDAETELIVKKELKPTETTTKKSDLSMNESFDEIAAPFYTHKAKVHSPPLNAIVSTVSKPKQNAVQVSATQNEQARDPIQELNQYCSESANSDTMFKSYNETLSKRNLVDSPVHPPFYEEEIKPSSSSEKQKKKPKKTKNVAQLPSSEGVPREIAPSTPEKPKRLSPSVTNSLPDLPHHQQAANQSPRQLLVRPIPPAVPQRYHARPPPPPHQSIQSHAYPMHQSHMTYSSGRNPYPSKYTQPPPAPSAQMHHYPHAYENSLNSFIQQQQPRSNIPMNPYSNPHLATGMWNPSSVAGTPTRSTVPPVYYSSPGPMPNPNFTIHQLLGNPYSMGGLSSAPNVPNMSQSSSSVHSPIGASQQTVTSTQSTQQSDSSTFDNRSTNTDKDMIRGMSDVISFIGDT